MSCWLLGRYYSCLELPTLMPTKAFSQPPCVILCSPSDAHLCDASNKLSSLRAQLEALKPEAELKLRPSAPRGERPYDKENPYHLRKALGDLDPAKLVQCYKRPLRNVRFEDEIEHPLKTSDGGVWFVKTAEVPPKILFRKGHLLQCQLFHLQGDNISV